MWYMNEKQVIPDLRTGCRLELWTEMGKVWCSGSVEGGVDYGFRFTWVALVWMEGHQA